MKDHIIHREISWLSFNARVLQEANDPRNPLIERLRFLGIFSNNLDEFFRVRVATVKRLINLGKKSAGIVGYSPQKVLNNIQELVISLQKENARIYQQILKELETEDIVFVDESGLNPEQEAFVKEYFEEVVEPLLVPIMIKNLRRFPYLRDKSVYLFVSLLNNGPKDNFALIEIPTENLSRFLVLPSHDGKQYVMYLDDVIRHHLPDLFSVFEFDKIESYIIKMTRDAELDLDDDISRSYYDKLKKSLERRKKGDPVRFIYDRDMPEEYLKFLMKKMKISEDDNLLPGIRYHNFRDFMKFPALGSSDLVHPKFESLDYQPFSEAKSMFSAITEKDHLLHYPFQSFDYLIHLLREAAIDPGVRSIKISLYRLASDSRVINTLINARKNGKEVTVVIELQARFDEEANLQWSKVLKDEGVYLVFGISGLKIHSKLVAITRKEGSKIATYVNVSTGNFHEGTARLYGDTALFTKDKRITEEVNRVFELIMKPYLPYHFEHLLVSPIFMRKNLYKWMDNEIANAKKGKPAWIKIKVNSLVDDGITEKLIEASKAGVKIDMVVRGICSLKSGVKGVTDNITAVSILDRFLEHSRIFVFCNNLTPQYYISSADLMTRNLDFRIEVATPIYDLDLQKQLDDYLDIQFKDNVKARVLDGEMDNKYKLVKGDKVRAQVDFYEYLRKFEPQS